MQKLLEGLRQFMTSVHQSERALFQSLASGQRPDVLFVTCSDSRVVPNLFTQTGPGELFTIRNAGNLIPPAELPSGEAGSIEFAVQALNVKDAIVCGHSDCGAMKGLLTPASLERLPRVAEWLAHAARTWRIVETRCEGLSAAERLRRAIEINVLVQLSHLAAHPVVAERLATGDLRLHGWVYDIGAGQVSAFDSQLEQFVSVTDQPHVLNGVSTLTLGRLMP